MLGVREALAEEIQQASVTRSCRCTDDEVGRHRAGTGHSPRPSQARLEPAMSAADLQAAGRAHAPGHQLSPNEGVYMTVKSMEDSLRRESADAAEERPAEPPVAAGISTAAQKALRRLMHRLDIVSDKLIVVTTSDRWSTPGAICSEDSGLVAITRDASQEIANIYCDLAEWVLDHVGITRGPWVESFDEAEEAQS